MLRRLLTSRLFAVSLINSQVAIRDDENLISFVASPCIIKDRFVCITSRSKGNGIESNLRWNIEGIDAVELWWVIAMQEFAYIRIVKITTTFTTANTKSSPLSVQNKK